MGLSVGFGIGPIRYSARLPRGSRGRQGDDELLIVLLGYAAVAAVIAALSRAPEWAYEATTGRWGVTVFFLGVAGIAFLLAGPMIPVIGTVPLASWSLYLLYQAGWWSLAERSLRGAHDNLLDREWNSVDHVVLNCLGCVAWLGVALVALAPVILAASGSYVINSLLGEVTRAAGEKIGRLTPLTSGLALVGSFAVAIAFVVGVARWPDSWPTDSNSGSRGAAIPMYRVPDFTGRDVKAIGEELLSKNVARHNMEIADAVRKSPGEMKASDSTPWGDLIVCSQMPRAGTRIQLPRQFSSQTVLVFKVRARPQRCPEQD